MSQGALQFSPRRVDWGALKGLGWHGVDYEPLPGRRARIRRAHAVSPLPRPGATPHNPHSRTPWSCPVTPVINARRYRLRRCQNQSPLLRLRGLRLRFRRGRGWRSTTAKCARTARRSSPVSACRRRGASAGAAPAPSWANKCFQNQHTQLGPERCIKRAEQQCPKGGFTGQKSYRMTLADTALLYGDMC